eukprot:CAMPEP_0184643928 /NCGR_PEP_ID=MMETSP0308-20130426/739_1 /TAXON_ID=38269 /ORGANISM="Gloeochaete witrockiana, Strain SAG 46.84" /LENGTH=315 /DNA_ID=CAMNT_0027072197 /DNA_START=138 /DNA_END=1085 /DNA_ORIENTATION=+
MKDRLKDLKGADAEADSADLDDVELGEKKKRSSHDDSENGDDVEDENGGFMSDFFSDVGAIKASMATIKKNVKSIEQLQSKALTTIDVTQKEEITEELDELMTETNSMAQQIRFKLKSIDKDNQDAVKKNGMTSETRIRTNMHGTLTRKFVDLMSEFQEVQTSYRNKIKSTVERQLKIVNPDATAEQIEDALENPSAQIFANGVLSKGHSAAKNALADIQERHRDIVKLEQSIAELHQLFVDMSVLVESQGELLDQIEMNVTQAAHYTHEGVKELHTARKYQKKAYKKMCWIILCLVIVLIIVLVPVLLTTMRKS